MTSHPTMGVEEEFLLVDPDTGDPVAVSRDVSAHAAKDGVDLALELTSCQLETTSKVASNSVDLRAELADLRAAAARAADAAGARLLAVGLPPSVPNEFPITDTPRYREIGERFGMIAREQGICGCHVHVEVPSRAHALQVSNRLRPWLPLLLAVSANSAIYRSADTGHASWRSVLWARWPSAGPPPHFDSVDEYDAAVRLLQVGEMMLDDGMVYWDVRPSANFPTIEVRVADVPATVDETVLLATLIRAAVMTALDEERRGEVLQPLAPFVLKAAYWKSARDGLNGRAIDLFDGHAAVPTPELLFTLIDRLTPALAAVGELAAVRDAVDRVIAVGNGAMRQRRAWTRRHDVADVVDEAASATLEGL